QEVLAAARAYVSAITLRVSIDHAQVTLDGVPIGESPFASEIFVEPGPHTLFATAPGCEPAKDRVRTEKASSHYLTLTFTKCGDKPPPPPWVLPPPRPRPITVGGFIATGTGLGLGTAFAILAKVKADDADQKFQSIASATHNNSNACAGP